MTSYPTEEDRSQAVKNAIAQRKMLLVIDDAWDIEAANLMRCGGPNCVHLLTTRNQEIARDFAGPQGTQNIPALEEPDAFDMLEYLAPEACDANPEAARKLADAVGGLPLALELLGRYLAAPERSYFPELSAEAFAEISDPSRRLELAQSRLGAITSDETTLSETIALSLEDLPKEAANAFHALGAFASKPESFDLDAAVAVSEVDSRTLALLISRSLLEKDGERLTLHQTLADFARQNTPSEASTRHKYYYLVLAVTDPENWSRIETEYSQILWAWDQAEESEWLLAMIYALRIYRERRGLWREDLDWIHVGLRVAEKHGMRQHKATLLNNMGLAYDALGQREKVLALYNQALAIREDEGDRAGIATILNNMGRVYSSLGQPDTALEYFSQDLRIHEQLGNRSSMGPTFNNIGIVYHSLDQPQKALEYFFQDLRISEEVRDRAGMATALNSLGMYYSEQDQQERALDYYNQALLLRNEVGDRAGTAITLNNIAGIRYKSGQPKEALGGYNQALSILQEVGDIYVEGATRFNMATIFNETGDLKEAETQLLRVVEVWKATQAPELPMAQEALAEVQHRLAEGPH